MKVLKKLLLVSIGSLLIASEYNPSLDLDSAKKYINNKNYNLAIAACDRVLMNDPNNDQANFYLAKIYWAQKDEKLAKLYFKKIKTPTPQMKQEIDKFYSLYPQRKIKFDLNFMVGMNVDSNIYNDTDAEYWDIYVDGDKKTIHHYKDKKYAFSGYELLTFDPVYKYKNYKIHNNFVIYNKNVIDHTENNIQLFSYSPFLTQKIDKFNLKHFLKYSYIRYGDEDYIQKFGIGENIKFNFLKDHTNETKLYFGYNHYLNSAELNEDYFQFNLNSKVTKHLNKYLDLALGVGYENHTDKNKNDNATEYDKYQTNFKTNLKLFSYMIDLGVDYEYKKYKDKNELFQKTQIDKNLHYQLAFNRYGFLTYQTKFEYIKNISNIEPYSYNKWVISINLIKTFKGL